MMANTGNSPSPTKSVPGNKRRRQSNPYESSVTRTHSLSEPSPKSSIQRTPPTSGLGDPEPSVSTRIRFPDDASLSAGYHKYMSSSKSGAHYVRGHGIFSGNGGSAYTLNDDTVVAITDGDGDADRKEDDDGDGDGDGHGNSNKNKYDNIHAICDDTHDNSAASNGNDANDADNDNNDDDGDTDLILYFIKKTPEDVKGNANDFAAKCDDDKDDGDANYDGNAAGADDNDEYDDDGTDGSDNNETVAHRTQNLPFPCRDGVFTPCSICYELRSLRPRMCCSLPVCDDCLLTYLTTQVEHRNVQMECPGVDCREYIHRDEILFRLSPQFKDKYYRFLVDTNTDPNVKTCPRCSHIHQRDDKVKIGHTHWKTKPKRKVTCTSCDLLWCFDCHAPWHESMSCREYRKGDKSLTAWAKLPTNSGRSRYEIGLTNAKRCPKCKVSRSCSIINNSNNNFCLFCIIIKVGNCNLIATKLPFTPFRVLSV
jgi:hypothetical protein